MGEQFSNGLKVESEVRFCSILEAWEGKIFRAATVMCGNTDDAEVVMADVFSRLYEVVSQLPSDQSVSSVICELLFELVDARLGSKDGVVYKTHSESAGYQQSLFENCEPGYRPPLKRLVMLALGRLPREYRQAVMLRDYFCHSYVSCAEILGVEEEFLRALVRRARLMLRRELSGMEDLSPEELSVSLCDTSTKDCCEKSPEKPFQ
jgi:DNA-directed RNA polymerase specialized sigma24 family protein